MLESQLHTKVRNGHFPPSGRFGFTKHAVIRNNTGIPCALLPWDLITLHSFTTRMLTVIQPRHTRPSTTESFLVAFHRYIPINPTIPGLRQTLVYPLSLNCHSNTVILLRKLGPRQIPDRQTDRKGSHG